MTLAPRVPGRAGESAVLAVVLPVLVFHDGMHEAAERLVFLAPLDVRQIVELRFLHEFQIALQVLFTQFVCCDCRTNGATRLAGVAAIDLPSFFGPLMT